LNPPWAGENQFDQRSAVAESTEEGRRSLQQAGSLGLQPEKEKEEEEEEKKKKPLEKSTFFIPSQH